jgi:MoxR-like ATPase
VRRTRELDGVMLGASSRAAIHLMSATKARACLEGRPTVTVDDVFEMAPFVLTHRLICEDEMTPEEALRMAMESPLI